MSAPRQREQDGDLGAILYWYIVAGPKRRRLPIDEDTHEAAQTVAFVEQMAAQ
jgi:hypothetical protein